MEFYIKGVGWLVADPTFSYRDGDSSGQMTDWSRFANIVNSHRLIYTCEYLPDNNSVIYNYQGAAPLISYSSELALYSVISPFTDLTNHWAAEAVLGLYYNTPPLVNGLSESYFGVGENLTRAQFAALLNRALDRVAPLPDGALADKLYTDIATGHWAYDDIYKAAAPRPALRLHGRYGAAGRLYHQGGGGRDVEPDYWRRRFGGGAALC